MQQTFKKVRKCAHCNQNLFKKNLQIIKLAFISDLYHALTSLNSIVLHKQLSVELILNDSSVQKFWACSNFFITVISNLKTELLQKIFSSPEKMYFIDDLGILFTHHIILSGLWLTATLCRETTSQMGITIDLIKAASHKTCYREL